MMALRLILLPALALAAYTGTRPSVFTSLPVPASTPPAANVHVQHRAASAAAAAAGYVVGQSTFYGGNLGGGTCSFNTYTLPAGIYGTAFSGAAWSGASSCGACVQVWNSAGKSIKAMIVDQCPECEASHLDLFQNAFLQLGTLSEGIIATSYSYVPCGIASPLVLRNKSGASQYWFSMQVVNSNQPVARLDVSTDGGGTWAATTRRDYNFFENPSGFGTQTVDVRVTSRAGQAVVVKNVSVLAGVQTGAGGNFA